MGKYTKYRLYQKYETRGSQEAIPCYPNVFSIDGAGTMPLVIVEENSRDCGYTGETQPIYRWYTLPIDTYYYCDACQDAQYKWVNLPIYQDWECVGTTKYYKQKKQVSVDGGSTWTDVTPPQYQRGALYEYSSQSCGYRTRTTTGSPYCEGYDKYVDVYSQYSTDGGNTWQTTATTPTMVEHNSAYCGYVPDPQYRTTSGTPYCSGYDKYVDVYSQVSYDEGVTWQTTATTPTMVEHNSSFCGYEVKYRTTSGTSYCDGYSKYVPVYSQVSYDMGTTWETTATTNVLIESYSQDCGYVPLTRWVESGWTCVGYDKYVNNVQQISYDNGQTWVNTSNTSASTLIESYSTDCGVMYRWTDTDVTTCSGVNKYYIAYKEMSLNGGQTWTEVSPRVTGLGTLVESTSMDCTKLWTSYSDGNTYATPCDSNTYISRNTTRPEGYYFMRMTHAKVGNCVTEIYTSAFGETPSGGSYEGYSACTALTDCVLGNSITRIGQRAFYKCSSLTGITIPNTIESIENYAFLDCHGLQSVTILAAIPPSLGADVFKSSVSTASYPIYVPCDSVNAYKTASGWSEYASRIQGVQPCEQIMYRWVESGWTCVGFDKYVNNVLQVSYDSGSTWENTSRTSASTLIEANSTDCGYVVLELKLNANYSNGANYYKECDGSSTLTSGETRPSGYIYTAMTSVEVGDCVTAIGNGAFRDCSGLTNCTIGSGVTSIGYDAFAWCVGLRSIEIPSGVTSIGMMAFQTCRALTSVTFSNGITSIGESAFYGCTALRSVTIPSSITTLGGSMVFGYCDRLSTIIVEATTPPSLGYAAFEGSPITKIYVPEQSVNAYKTAYRWSAYADIIQAIP